MNVVDIVNPNWEADDHKLAKEMVEYGMSLYASMSARNKDISDVYNMYHGDYTKAEKTAMTTVHGKVSSTELSAHRLPKVKIDQLLGESLEVSFSIEVDTISPVERQKKADEEMKAKGRSYTKPIIDSVKEQGFNIYEGVEIPEFNKNMSFDPEQFRTKNELISQRIANEKIKDAIQKNIYYYAFSSNVFASEIFTRTIVDRNGHTGIENIQPERMIYPRMGFDQFNETAPIMGHWSMMTFADIIREFDIKKTDEKYKLIGNLFQNTTTGGSMVQVPMTSTGEYDFSSTAALTTSQMSQSVYYFQWRYYVEKVFRKNTDGSIDFKDAKEIADKTEIEANPDQYTVLPFERLYQGASVAGQIYVGFKDVEDFAISTDANGRIRANYDYISTLVKTFGGKRTSFAKVMIELGKKYDYARWLLFREIRKTKSAALYVDRAYMGLKNKESILHDLEDEGILEIDSKNRFDETGMQLTDGKQVIGSIASGSNNSLIRDLIAICLDLERVLDATTGITEARKGTEMATTTATTAQNNLQASRSVTYDEFYFTENHMARQFTHLIQKTKSRIHNGSKEHYAYLPAEDIAYLEESPEYFIDNFSARMVGGRRSQQIFAELSDVIKSEMAAGKRSSVDFAKIKQSESLSEAVNILEMADAKLQEIARQSQDADNQTKMALNENAKQAAQEDREDRQAAEKVNADNKNATTIENTKLKISSDITKASMQAVPKGMPAINKPKK